MTGTGDGCDLVMVILFFCEFPLYIFCSQCYDKNTTSCMRQRERYYIQLYVMKEKWREWAR